MRKPKKAIFVLIFISMIFIISTNLSPQENAEKAKLQQKKKESVLQEKVEKPPEFKQYKEYPQEDILRDAQSTFNRSLSILNIVVTIMGVLVGLITLVVIILSLFGFFEIKNWRETRQKIKADAQVFKDLRSNMENEMEELREKTKDLPKISLAEKPSKEIMNKLDDFGRKLEQFESLGLPLNAEDYIKHGNDLYYKEKFSLALESYERAIKLKPDYGLASYNKGCALGMLTRYKEAVKAYERAIKLKPDDKNALYNMGCILGILTRYEEAIKAIERVVKLKPDDEEALFLIARFSSLMGDKDKALKNLKISIELNPQYKEKAKKVTDLKELWNDDDFKKITS